MSDTKKKQRWKEPEPWADRVTWMPKEKAIRERQRLYGSTRIRLIPKKEEVEKSKHDETKPEND